MKIKPFTWEERTDGQGRAFWDTQELHRVMRIYYSIQENKEGKFVPFYSTDDSCLMIRDCVFDTVGEAQEFCRQHLETLVGSFLENRKRNVKTPKISKKNAQRAREALEDLKKNFEEEQARESLEKGQ